MIEEKYFMISSCEDGPGFQVLTREELLKHLQETIDEEIETNYIDDASTIDGDLMYFPNCSTLIIKGRVVAPIAVKVTKKLEIE